MLICYGSERGSLLVEPSSSARVHDPGKVEQGFKESYSAQTLDFHSCHCFISFWLLAYLVNLQPKTLALSGIWTLLVLPSFV
jgi:hypothetical protein